MASRPGSFLAPDQQSLLTLNSPAGVQGVLQGIFFCRVELSLTQPGIYGQGQCPVYEDSKCQLSYMTFSFLICKMGNHLSLCLGLGSRPWK